MSEQKQKDRANILSHWPNVWCPNCEAIRPLAVGEMPATDKCDHDAADLLCGECAFIVATLHAKPTGSDDGAS